MEETSRHVLDLLRSDERTAWIAAQLLASFAEGISQSAKDVVSHGQPEFVDFGTLSSKERTKREKYETSRAYSEAEKLELIRFALREVFVTLPKMQQETATRLHDLGSRATSIEFLQPDDEERVEASYTRTLQATPPPPERFTSELEAFLQRLQP